MKRKRSILVVIVMVLVISAGQLGFHSDSALAQSGGYDLTWNRVDGGGGTSSGGAFSLSGSIGQPDAGRLSGGTYTLNGGFWNEPFVALQKLFLPLIQR